MLSGKINQLSRAGECTRYSASIVTKNRSLQTKLGVLQERRVFQVSKLQLTFYQVDIRTADRKRYAITVYNEDEMIDMK